MKPSRPERFNAHSKSKDFFPIKQYRFDTTNHPIVQSRKECKFRLKTILSHQEEQQLEGLINSLQCSKREAIRISFYEALRRGKESLQTVLIYALRDSKERGHTARSKTLTVALPNAEKKALLELGKELDLSEKEIARLAIIWLAYGIKYEAITRIHKCQRISYDKLADKWSKENRGKAPNPQMKKLKEARDIEKEILIAMDEGAGLDSCNTFFTNSWNRLNYNNNHDRYHEYAKKHGYKISQLNGWEKQILAIMIMFRFTFKQAVDTYYEDRREADKVMRLSRAEFLQHIRDNQEQDNDSFKASEYQKEQHGKRINDEEYSSQYQLYFAQAAAQNQLEDEEIIVEFFETKTNLPKKEKEEQEREEYKAGEIMELLDKFLKDNEGILDDLQ